ncbi:hypothetical protein HA44_20045 [Mixta gaviniae]|nr:hypothetical protein HA44_20045 [Mixta gaviniae]
MAKYYYVNKKTGRSAIHRVHTADCPLLAPLEERFFLGTFYSQLDAVKQARKYYLRAEICESCGQRPLKKALNEKIGAACRPAAFLLTR